ncbi:hypothetical protein VO54_03694 [Elizabethkingia miricola]|nr:hypothetical protein VO54_03694 [Elizabethkingia miricola]
MQDFLRHIKSKNQKFRCYECCDENKTLTVDIYNELKPGVTENEIPLLTRLFSEESEEIVAFYKMYNGIKLYCSGVISGLKIYPVNDLERLNEEWKEELSCYEQDELYDFQNGGVAFGEIPYSGNHFVLFEGKVFYNDHDGGDDTPVGNTFNDFLSKIAIDPAGFLYDMGCYTRYSDGKTEDQYIPKEFFADEDELSLL